MEDDRLSALGIIKMASNMIIDYELILEEFIKIKERRLLLVCIINLNRISFKNVFFLSNKIS